MKDYNSTSDNDVQFTELVQLAIRCVEDGTTPEATPTSTPSSTPPSRRKRRQRQSKSPAKEKSNAVNLPVVGGASVTATSKNKLLSVVEDKSNDQLQVITIPLTTSWNTETVYIVEQQSEIEVSELVGIHLTT